MFLNLLKVATVALASVGLLAIGFIMGYGHDRELQTQFQIPTELHADSASSGKMMSCATGWIDEDVEGLFVLDHLTGTLYCWVIDPRTGVLGASFQTNVTADLSPDGRAADVDYVMVTGSVRFSGNRFTGPNRPARTVVYVGEGNNGRVGAYMLRYRGANTGLIERIGVGQTRAAGLQRE